MVGIGADKADRVLTLVPTKPYYAEAAWSNKYLKLSWNMWLGVQDISVLAYKKAKLK